MHLSNDSSGFLLIDKEAGLSSFDVIRQLRKICQTRKIGHSGTLDPFATGLMIYSLGRYTRLCNLLETANKSYEATVYLGTSTDSGDLTGKPVHSQCCDIDTDKLGDLKDAVQCLKMLPIPQYSAVKINGKRAYKYAREDVYVEIPDREVTISDFELLEYCHPSLRYRCTVSKGTYIRSLSEWIASFLGTVGHTTTLRRVSIDTLSVQSSTKLADLTSENWQQHLFPEREIFSSYPHYCASESEVSELWAGRKVFCEGPDTPQILVFDKDEHIRSVCNRQDNNLNPKMNLVK